MAQTQEETQAVLAAEQSAKGKLAIGFNRRFAPACARTKALMHSVKRPWFINYRLMYPNPEKREGFYATQERILYEGCHILDLVCWLLDAAPRKVYMTGERLHNNCCILDYTDGSQVSFMCGSMGSYCLWKEYMEVFGAYTAITISDFVDMRVRGFEGQYDQLFPPYLNEHADEVLKFGFDFYETYKGAEVYQYRQHWQNYGMTIEPVRRPVILPVEVSQYSPLHPDGTGINPDKGWVQSLEHFAECLLNGSTPQNADGNAGALSTTIALALLKSLETGQPVAL
jgi:predicted dehydrogenase